MPRPAVIGLMLALAAVFWPWSIGAQPQPSQIRLLGQFSFESRRTFQDTTVGGLSGLAYDAKRGVYSAVSDDRGENQPPRFYTLAIDTGPDGWLMKAALREGMLYVPGVFCHVADESGRVASNEMRLAYGVATEDQIGEATWFDAAGAEIERRPLRKQH